jgi:hypothetical protein
VDAGAVVVVVIGYLPGRAEPRGLGQPRPQQTRIHLTINPSKQSHKVTKALLTVFP